MCVCVWEREGGGITCLWVLWPVDGWPWPVDGLCFHLLRTLDYFFHPLCGLVFVCILWIFFCPLWGLLYFFFCTLTLETFLIFGFWILFLSTFSGVFCVPTVLLSLQLNPLNLGCSEFCVCSWILFKPEPDIRPTIKNPSLRKRNRYTSLPLVWCCICCWLPRLSLKNLPWINGGLQGFSCETDISIQFCQWPGGDVSFDNLKEVHLKPTYSKYKYQSPEILSTFFSQYAKTNAIIDLS